MYHMQRFKGSRARRRRSSTGMSCPVAAMTARRSRRFRLCGLVLLTTADITCLSTPAMNTWHGTSVCKTTCLCQNTGRSDYQIPDTPRPRGQSDDTDGLTWHDVHGPTPILKAVASTPSLHVRLEEPITQGACVIGGPEQMLMMLEAHAILR